MPFLVWPLIAGLSGAFIGSQVDNAVQSKASAPAIIDQSKMPWYVTVILVAVFAYFGFQMLKKVVR